MIKKRMMNLKINIPSLSPLVISLVVAPFVPVPDTLVTVTLSMSI